MSQKSENDDMIQAVKWRADKPFNELPLLPPPTDLETKRVLKACVGARAALAGLQRSAELIPNPAMLINTLPVLEARASSEIENIVTTADELFRHQESESKADPATREALRYRHALLDGFAALGRKPLGTGTAEAVCSRIRGVDMSVRRVPGTVLKNETSGKIVYTPPETEERLRNLLANWERFLHGADGSDAVDPLVRMAVCHYQFEAIHPFTDGNGRTGRVLNSLFLVEAELLPLPILFLSRFIVARKADYYRLLLGVTSEGAWEPWILYMLQAVEETAMWTSEKIAAIRDLSAATVAHARARLPKIYSRELIDLLFEQPYCRIARLVDGGIAGRQAASRYLKALVAIGVLTERAVGREKLFVHSRLLDLLIRDWNRFKPYE